MISTIRVLVADDHSIVREGLRALLETCSDMELVAEATDGGDAVEKAQALQPDVILMDLVMPRVDGIEAIRRIRAANPEARILVLTSFAEDDKVFPAIEAGALGYLLKDVPPQELLRAIRDVHEGRSHLNGAVTLRLMRRMANPSLSEDPSILTPRETEVLQHVARGLSNQEIARCLCITERTAANHVAVILEKLHLSNRTQAALYALKRGLVRLDET